MMTLKKCILTPFTLLDSLVNRFLFTAGALLFIFLFLHLFVPFNITNWINYPDSLAFLGMSLFAIVGFFFISISQLFVRSFWRRGCFLRLHAIILFLAELLTITLAFTILFKASGSSFIREFFITLKFTFLTLLLWYALGLAFLSAIKKRDGYQRSVDPASKGSDFINFKDENGKLKISVRNEDLLYIESADNYIMIYFLLNGNIKKEMVRNTMKKVQSDFENVNVVRCHRSFMVNLDNMILASKKGRNYALKLRHVEHSIPISRSFIPRFKSFLDS